jgi:hypothetical protein
MRLSLRAASLLAVALTTLSCTDAPTGPGAGHSRAGRLGLAPSFSPNAARAFAALAQIGVDIAHVRIRLVNAGGVVVKDTTVDFPAADDTLTISMPVAIQGTEQSFTATIDLTDAGGVVLFSSTQSVTARDASLPAGTPPVITLEFVGPGASARTVTVSPPTGTIAPAGTQLLTASATNAAGTAVSNLLVLWSSSDTTVARIVSSDSSTASVQGTGRRGAVTFTARTLGGVSGTAQLTFLPQPGRLVAVSGGAQSGEAGRALPQPFVVQLLGVDSIGIAGQTVTFRGVTAGGTVAAASVTTDSAGLARTTMTLGRTPGAYQFEAAVGAILATAQETAVAGTASQFVVTQPLPAQLSVGAVAPLPFRAMLADDVGNPVATAGVVLSAAVTVAPGGQTFSASASTDSTGAVTLALPAYVGPVGTATVVISSPLFGPISTSTIPVVPGPAAALTLTQQPPATSASGATLAPAPAVQLVDVGGNSVGAALAITASVSGGAALGGTTTVTTTSAGSASFPNLAISGPAGTYALSFSATGVATVTSNAVAVGAGTATALTLDPSYSTSGVAGSDLPVPPRVTLKDASGNPVPGTAVSFTITAGGGSASTPSVATDAAGVATLGAWHLGTTAGTNSIRITVPSIPAVPPVDVSVAGVAGPPTTFTYVSGSGSAVTGQAITVKAQVADANGNPVAGRGVTWVVGAGSGSVAPATSVSGPTGVSSATWTLGFATGVQTLTATPDFPAGAVSFSDTVSVAPGARLKIVAEPAAATNGVALSPQPQVQLVDASGSNPIAQAGVTVTATLVGSGTLQGTITATTNAAGRAQFTDLSIVGQVGAYHIDVAASGFTGASSGTFALAAGAATALKLVQAPGATATSGSPLSPAPVVQLVDGGGNPTTASVNVTATLASGPGTIGGTLSVAADASGQASFTDLRLSGQAGTYTVSFSAPGVAAATTAPITLSLAPATHLGILTPPPDTAVSGVALSKQPVIVLLDANENRVRHAGDTVSAALASGVGSERQNLAITDSAGEAHFTALMIFGMAGPVTLKFDARGLTQVVSAPFTLVPGAAERLSIRTAPSTAADSGRPLAQQPVIGLMDGGGNLVMRAGVLVKANIASGVAGSRLLGDTASTDASGLAHFQTLQIDGSMGQYKLVFTSDTMSVTSAQINVTIPAPPMPASVRIVNDQEAGIVLDQLRPSIVLLDQYGKPMPNYRLYTINIRQDNGSGGTDGSVTTDSTGQVSFDWFLSAHAQEDTAEVFFNANAQPLLVTVKALPGAAKGLVFEVLPDTAIVDSPLPKFAVYVTDIGGVDTLTAEQGDITLTLLNSDGFPMDGIKGTPSRPLVNGIASFDDITVGSAMTTRFGASDNKLDLGGRPVPSNYVRFVVDQSGGSSRRTAPVTLQRSRTPKLK